MMSIKGHNSVTYLRKMTDNHTNLDLVNINANITFGLNLSICFKGFERK